MWLDSFTSINTQKNGLAMGQILIYYANSPPFGAIKILLMIMKSLNKKKCSNAVLSTGNS